MAKFYDETLEFPRDISYNLTYLLTYLLTYNLTDTLIVWKFW
jgi:hypothetical protein